MAGRRRRRRRHPQHVAVCAPAASLAVWLCALAVALVAICGGAAVRGDERQISVVDGDGDARCEVVDDSGAVVVDETITTSSRGVRVRCNALPVALALLDHHRGDVVSLDREVIPWPTSSLTVTNATGLRVRGNGNTVSCAGEESGCNAYIVFAECRDVELSELTFADNARETWTLWVSRSTEPGTIKFTDLDFVNVRMGIYLDKSILYPAALELRNLRFIDVPETCVDVLTSATVLLHNVAITSARPMTRAAIRLAGIAHYGYDNITLGDDTGSVLLSDVRVSDLYSDTQSTLSPLYIALSQNSFSHEARVNITVADCQFRNISLSGSATYVSGTGSTVVFTKCKWTDNEETNNEGGAVTLVNTYGTVRFEECTFENNEGRASGGAVSVEQNSDVHFEKCVFTGNSARRGGAIYTESASLTVRGGSFTDNTARYDGGAVVATAAYGVRINGVTFKGHTAIGGSSSYENGGTISISYTTANRDTFKNTWYPLELVDLEVLNSNATVGDGGAVYINSLHLALGGGLAHRITNVNMLSCFAGGIGGCFHYGSTSSHHGSTVGGATALAMRGVTMRSGVARSFGGCCAVSFVSLEMRDTAVSDCTSSGASGAGLHFRGTSHSTLDMLRVNVSDAYFEPRNRTATEGGALYTSSGSVNVRSCRLSNAQAHHGGLLHAEGGKTRLTDNVFMGGVAMRGGAVYITPPQRGVRFSGNRFEANYASRVGGALYVELFTDNVELRGDTFSDNAAGIGARFDAPAVTLLDAKEGLGGAIFTEAALYLERIVCVGNFARTGGCVRFHTRSSSYKTVSTVVASVFDNNTATNGGAVALTDDHLLVLRDSNFTGNSAAAAGGGIFASGTDLIEVMRCRFTACAAELRGGAIEFFSSNTSTTFGGAARITESMFVRNTAAMGGAVSLVSGFAATLDRCSLMGNVALSGGGAVLVYDDSRLTARRCEFSGNAARGALGGGALLVDDVDRWQYLEQCDLFANAADVAGAGAAVHVVVGTSSRPLGVKLIDTKLFDHAGAAVRASMRATTPRSVAPYLLFVDELSCACDAQNQSSVVCDAEDATRDDAPRVQVSAAAAASNVDPMRVAINGTLDGCEVVDTRDTLLLNYTHCGAPATCTLVAARARQSLPIGDVDRSATPSSSSSVELSVGPPVETLAIAALAALLGITCLLFSAAGVGVALLLRRRGEADSSRRRTSAAPPILSTELKGGPKARATDSEYGNVSLSRASTPSTLPQLGRAPSTRTEADGTYGSVGLEPVAAANAYIDGAGMRDSNTHSRQDEDGDTKMSMRSENVRFSAGLPQAPFIHTAGSEEAGVEYGRVVVDERVSQEYTGVVTTKAGLAEADDQEYTSVVTTKPTSAGDDVYDAAVAPLSTGESAGSVSMDTSGRSLKRTKKRK